MLIILITSSSKKRCNEAKKQTNETYQACQTAAKKTNCWFGLEKTNTMQTNPRDTQHRNEIGLHLECSE